MQVCTNLPVAARDHKLVAPALRYTSPNAFSSAQDVDALLPLVQSRGMLSLTFLVPASWKAQVGHFAAAEPSSFRKWACLYHVFQQTCLLPFVFCSPPTFFAPASWKATLGHFATAERSSFSRAPQCAGVG